MIAAIYWGGVLLLAVVFSFACGFDPDEDYQVLPVAILVIAWPLIAVFLLVALFCHFFYYLGAALYKVLSR